MKVSEYIQYLVYGEAFKLAVSSVGDMSLNPGTDPTEVQLVNQKKFISYINLANLAIHKRFHLIQRIFEIDHPMNDEEYTLPSDFLVPIYAYYAGQEPQDEIPIKDTYKKIVDSTDVAVSILLPEPFKAVIKGTDTEARKNIELVYAASPPKVTRVTTELNLSDVYTEALLNYAAYRAYSAISGDIKAENNSYYLRYESNCRQIVTSGLGGDNEIETNTKLTDNGFI